MELILKLVLVHIIIDFIFQTDKSVNDKLKHKLKSKKVYIHPLLHGIGSCLIIQTYKFIPFAILIIVSHFLIDLIKIYKENNNNKRLLFLIDQLLHLLIIGVVFVLYTKLNINEINIIELLNKNILLITCLVFITKPAAILVKVFISKWSLDEKQNNDEQKKGIEPLQEKETLFEAGMWIGILERLLIFGFIVIGKWEAIGFLLAAKSVFRFGDLKGTKDQSKTEYILIGTLSSFFIAIIIGYTFIQLNIKSQKNIDKINEQKIESVVDKSNTINDDKTSKLLKTDRNTTSFLIDI